MTLLDDFVAYLNENGVSLAQFSRQESLEISKRWTSVFAAKSACLNEIVGSKAVVKWLDGEADELIVLFLSSRITAFPISQNARPCAAFRYCGPRLDVSHFCELEFAVFPLTYEWTLVHTHEDGAFGGPYFLSLPHPE